MRRGFLIFVLVVAVAIFGGGGTASAQGLGARGIYGFWQTQDRDGVVELYPCEGAVCGRFAWLKDDSRANPSRDDKNPDPDLRKKPLCGLQFMGGFQAVRAQGGGAQGAQEKYDGGWIYSPRHGSRFSASLTLNAPDTLELRGYMLVPLLGESQIWTRQGAVGCYG